MERYGASSKLNDLKNKKKMIKIGEFRLMKDLPMEPVNQNKNFKSTIISRNNHHYQKIIVHQQNNYTLLSSKNQLSPIGNVAKMLMKVVLKSKNKTISKP